VFSKEGLFGGRSVSDVATAPEEAGIPAGSTADVATSGSRITPSVRGQYFQDGAEPPTCSYCQQNPVEHLDHVIPVVRGGDLSPENLTPVCSWCNLSKGARVAPVNPAPGYVGEWSPSFWPSRMLEWWRSTYGKGLVMTKIATHANPVRRPVPGCMLRASLDGIEGGDIARRVLHGSRCAR
jgi:hypothetical protein